jgi:histone deacetylase complex subunit SAP18
VRSLPSDDVIGAQREHPQDLGTKSTITIKLPSLYYTLPRTHTLTSYDTGLDTPINSLIHPIFSIEQPVMALQPSAADKVDRESTPPFLLRVFWRTNRTLDPFEFSVAPPADATASMEYFEILPANIQQSSLELYQWSDCTLGQLTSTMMSELPADAGVEVGSRLMFKLIFPDTRAQVVEGGKGKWIDKPLGSVVVGGRDADQEENDLLEGDANKTLADARFVIGDFVACAIYPPGPDGRVQPPPPGRAPYSGPRGPPRDNYGRGGGGGFGGPRGGQGGGGRGPMGGPPSGDWRRGERPNHGGGGGFRGGRGRY